MLSVGAGKVLLENFVPVRRQEAMNKGCIGQVNEFRSKSRFLRCYQNTRAGVALLSDYGKQVVCEYLCLSRLEEELKVQISITKF